MRSFGRPRLLLCDADVDFRGAAGRLLREAGYEPHVVGTAKEAIRALDRESFDVMLLGAELPDQRGSELLAVVRERDPDLPCVISAAERHFDDAVSCLRLGAVDYLVKPLDPDLLVRMIDRAHASTHLKVDSALLAATQSIFSSLDPRQIAPRVLGLVRSVLRASQAAIVLAVAGEPTETLAIGASGDQLVQRPRVPAEVWRRIADRRDPLLFQRDQPADTEVVELLAPGAHMVLAQRLMVGEVLVGALWGARPRAARAFGERDLRRTMILAGHAALALENARLHVETRAQGEELARTFDRLVVVERIASMARLSSGLGHEIANPASAVLASLEVLKDAIIAGRAEDAKNALHLAVTGTNAVLDVCRALRPFAARSGPGDDLVDLRQVVDAALLLATHELRPRARVTRHVAKDIPSVRADAGKLGQVFLNLLLNAAHAIEGTSAENEVRIYLGREGDEVVARVADTGRGVPAELREAIFEPNVTTRVGQGGQGMGLAICRWIVEEAGGTIRCVPDTARGSVFEVRLPAAKA